MIWFTNLKTRLIILVIVLLVAGIWLTAESVSDIIKLNGHVPDFNYESIADIKKGDFVCGYIENIFGNYANMTTTKTTMGIETSSYTSKEYFVMPLINDKDFEKRLYITISASKNEDIRLLNYIMNDTYDYLDGKENIQWHEMAFVGHAVKLDPELNSYLVEWFEDGGGFDDNIQNHIIPFELVCYNPKTAYTNLGIGLVMIAVVAIIAVIYIIKKRPQRVSQGGDYAAADNSFSESLSSGASQPMQYIPQPVQPDDFFAKPEKNNPQEAKSDPAPVNYSGEIDTSSLDTEKALYENEQAVISNYKPVSGSDGIETEGLDTEKALYEREQAIAANYKPVSESEGIETEGLDVERALYEQEQAIAANSKNVDDNGGIEIAGLDTDGLDYFDQFSAEENEDIFDFSNDVNFGETDTSKIETSD